MIELTDLPPAGVASWRVMFELTEAEPAAWMLVGGQAVHLLSIERGAGIVRPTNDMDVVVNVRVKPGGTEWVAKWLVQRGFDLSGVSLEGIGHRFTRAADPGPGLVVIDVLAPEGLGERARVFTRRPARTVQVPGSVQAFRRSEVVEVRATGIDGATVSGRVRRPNLLGALVAKAAATVIVARPGGERDFQDAALLLSLVADPIATAAECDAKDRARLRRLDRLRNRNDVGWALLDTEAFRRGVTTLDILLD